MKRINILIAAIGILTAVVASSCGSKTPINIRESLWIVKSINGEVPDTKGKALSIRISYSEGRIGGFSGCNSFGADLDRTAFDKGLIKIGDIISTRMACPGVYVEGFFLNALQNTISYTVKGNELYFYSDTASRTPTIIFQAAPVKKTKSA